MLSAKIGVKVFGFGAFNDKIFESTKVTNSDRISPTNLAMSVRLRAIST